jgi:hypothetical protein
MPSGQNRLKHRHALTLPRKLGAGIDIGDNERMQQSRRLTAIIEREGDGYVALCPELDVASQGDTLEGARVNLIEALTLTLSYTR